ESGDPYQKLGGTRSGIVRVISERDIYHLYNSILAIVVRTYCLDVRQIEDYDDECRGARQQERTESPHGADLASCALGVLCEPGRNRARPLCLHAVAAGRRRR